MSKNVVHFTGETKLPIPPNQVLQAAVDNLDDVLVIGWHKDGSFYLAFSGNDRAEINFLLDLGKKLVLDQVEL